MLLGQRIAVVLPAYNAEATLRRTYSEIPFDIVDDVILTDDGSTDNTAAISRELGIITLIHENNRGYGGNQKTCYAEALSRGADIVVMLHPDYQYAPTLVSAMASDRVEAIRRGSRVTYFGTRCAQGRYAALQIYRQSSPHFSGESSRWL